MTTAALAVQGLSERYGSVAALDGVDLELGGAWLPLWTVAYLAGVLRLAVWAFCRRDL